MRLGLDYWLDFFVPRQGLNCATIHSYLTSLEIESLPSFTKFLGFGGGGLDVLVAAPYQDDLIQDLLHRAKFGGELAIVDSLVDLLESKFGLRIQGLGNAVITCIPPDPLRWRRRGYHLPQLLAEKLAQRLNLPFRGLFKKVRHTTSQVELVREERIVALRGAFAVGSEFEQPVDKLLIVDDVTTTGTTLTEAALILKRNFAGLQIESLVVAG